MITFFSVPKPFTGHIKIIQTNAIRSWQLIKETKIYLVGDEHGIKEFSKKNNINHIENVKKNSYGTPMLDSVFKEVLNKTKDSLLCFTNTDIIFSNNLTNIISSIRLEKFVIIGRRLDIDINSHMSDDEIIDIINNKNSTIHTPSGSDYFIFKRGYGFENIPPFIVGRPGFDNWLIYHSKKLKIPVIDISNDYLIYHQNHTYDHVKNKIGQKWEGPEANYNYKLMGNTKRTALIILDADYQLINGKLKKPHSYEHINYYIRKNLKGRFKVMSTIVRKLRAVISSLN